MVYLDCRLIAPCIQKLLQRTNSIQNCAISTEAYQLECSAVQTTRAISDSLHWMLRLELRSSIEKHCHLFHKLLSQLSSLTDCKKSISPLPHLFLISAMQQWLTAERQLGTDAIFSPLKFRIRASQPKVPKVWLHVQWVLQDYSLGSNA